MPMYRVPLQNDASLVRCRPGNSSKPAVSEPLGALHEHSELLAGKTATVTMTTTVSSKTFIVLALGAMRAQQCAGMKLCS